MPLAKRNRPAGHYRQQTAPPCAIENGGKVDYLKQRGLHRPDPGPKRLRHRLRSGRLGQLDGPPEQGQYERQGALIEAGLVVENPDTTNATTAFATGSSFPIRDSAAETLGFGGRVTGGDDKPKYLNSRETPVYQNQGPRASRPVSRRASKTSAGDDVRSSEGYMDRYRPCQHGVTNAVPHWAPGSARNIFKRLFRIVNTRGVLL